MAKHIDPVYKQYASRIIKYLASTEFYDYFMSMLESGKNTFQFSNRKVEKNVDETWVTAIEAVLKPMEEIINNPRNFIIQEEIIVNVALIKRVTPDSVRHLAQHGSMVDKFDDEGVRPNRMMEQSKEDSWNTYENRFVYTLLEMAYEFVDKRYEAIFAAMGDEFGAYLKMHADAASYHESMSVNVDIRIRQEEELLSSDEKNESIFSRIARLHRVLSNFRGTKFAQEVSKYGKIKPPLVRTNAIAKNPNFKACHKLWNFILAYGDVGYHIEIYEQNPTIDESFTTDIYHSIMFDYIILKNYLENPGDREIDFNKAMKRKKLKPKFITEVIEEIVKNYDLPDVEIRKILIEEITKAQLMKEEEAERLRLVEEKEKEMRKRKQEEEREQARLAKEQMKERIRQEKEAEKERLRQEKLRQEEEMKQKREKEQREKELQQLAAALCQEVQKCDDDLQAYLDKKRAAEEQRIRLAEEEKARLKKAEETAARLAKEAEAREQERIRQQKQKEKELEMLRIERLKAKAKAEAARKKQKEKERELKQQKLLAEKEKARIAREKERAKEKAAQDKAAQAEKDRLAREKAKEKAAQEKAAQAEKERLAREKAKEKEKKEKAAQAEKERLAREKGKSKKSAEKATEKATEKAEPQDDLKETDDRHE